MDDLSPWDKINKAYEQGTKSTSEADMADLEDVNHIARQARYFRAKVNSILEFEEDRGKLFEALRSYHESRKVKRLVRDLKIILNNSKKYPLFKEIRALVPQEHLFAYDKLTEGARTGERIIRVKRHGNESLGLKFKGGLEHGIGIFVTAIIPGSSAHAAGVKVGDEILKINGLTLQESIHEEVVNLFKDKKSVTLVVKNNGRIPTKLNNEIVWEEIDAASQVDPPNLWDKNLLHLATSSEDNQTVVNKMEKDDRLLAFKVGKEGLGCSIRSGIAGFKGIYVSVVAKNSLAQQIGLKAGDQILDVNGKSFKGIKHAEAVDVLKSRNDLTMIVRHNKHVEEYFKRKRFEREGQKKTLQTILKKSPGPFKSSKNRANFGESLSVQVIDRDPSDNEEIDEPESYVPNPSNLEYDEAILQGKEVHFISIPKTGPLKLDLHQIRGRIVVVNVAKGGSAFDHGFIRRGDYLLNVEGTNLVGVTVPEAQAALSEAMGRLSHYIDIIVACSPGRTPIPPPLDAISPRSEANTPLAPTASKSPTVKSNSTVEAPDDLSGVRGRIAAFESMKSPELKPSLARRDSIEMMRNSLRLYQGKKRGDVPVDKLFTQDENHAPDSVDGSLNHSPIQMSTPTRKVEIQIHPLPSSSNQQANSVIATDTSNDQLANTSFSQDVKSLETLPSTSKVQEEYKQELKELDDPKESLYAKVNKGRTEKQTVTFASDAEKLDGTKDLDMTVAGSSNPARYIKPPVEFDIQVRESPYAITRLTTTDRPTGSAIQFNTLTEVEDEDEDENPYATISEAQMEQLVENRRGSNLSEEAKAHTFGKLESKAPPQVSTSEILDKANSSQGKSSFSRLDPDIGNTMLSLSDNLSLQNGKSIIKAEPTQSFKTFKPQKPEVISYMPPLPIADYESSSYETYIGTDVTIKPPVVADTSAGLVQAALKKVTFSESTQDEAEEEDSDKSQENPMSPSYSKSNQARPMFTLNNSLLSSAKDRLRKVATKKGSLNNRRHSVNIDSSVASSVLSGPTSPTLEARESPNHSVARNPPPPPPPGPMKRTTSMPLMDQMMNELKGKMLWRKASAKAKEQDNTNVDTNLPISATYKERRQMFSSQEILSPQNTNENISVRNSPLPSSRKEIRSPLPSQEAVTYFGVNGATSKGNSPSSFARSREELERDNRIQRRQAVVVEDIDSSTLNQPTASVNRLSPGAVIRNPKTGKVLDMEGTLKELDDVIKSLDEED